MAKTKQRKILEVIPYGSEVIASGIVHRITKVNKNDYSKSYCISNVIVEDNSGEIYHLNHVWINGDEVLETLDILEPVIISGYITSYTRSNDTIDYTIKPTKVLSKSKREIEKEKRRKEIIQKGEFMTITAKELFEMLGYRLRENDDNFIHYYKKIDENYYENITFAKQKYEWTVLCNEYSYENKLPMAISKGLFKAISQQLYELEIAGKEKEDTNNG